MVRDKDSFDRKPISNSDKSISNSNSLFQFSIFREEKPKEKTVIKRSSENSNGNLIVQILDIKAPEVLKWLKSIIHIETSTDINILLQIVANKTKVKKSNYREEYLIYFLIPSNYKVKYLYSKSISLFPRNQLYRNYKWFNANPDYIKISKTDTSLPMGEISLKNLESLILDSYFIR